MSLSTELDNDTPLLQGVSHFKTLKPRRLHLPLKDIQRSSAISHRFFQHSVERQTKLTQRLFPKVQHRSSSKTRKVDMEKGYLEHWISNELEDQQTQGQLKAIKKFEIDRKTLLNLQVSSEEIDKLYQTLYVYSHGVKNAFQQLVGKNEELMIRFWRVYILLLEDKNVSTVVEKRHQESLNIVMRTLEASEQQLQTLRRQFADKQRYMSKDIQIKEDQIQRIKDEKDILQSNLMLTDEAFNEQVSRRLKFQQKINEINTIHNELKSKYLRLVEELNIYQSLDLKSKESRKQVEFQAKTYQVRIGQLQRQLEDTKERLKQTEQDCSLMKSQIYQLKQQQLKTDRDDQKQFLQLKDVLIREKKYKLQMQNEVEAKHKMDSLFSEKTIELTRLSRQLDLDRAKLESERKSKIQLQGRMHALIKHLEENQQQFRQLSRQNVALVNKEKTDATAINQMTGALNNIRNIQLFQSRSIQSLQTNVKTLEKVIEDQKGTIAKHQTMSEVLTFENEKLLESVKQLKTSEFALRQSNRELSLKLLEKQSLDTTKEITMRNQIQLSKQKVKSITTQLSNKEKSNSDLIEKISKLREVITQKDYQKEQLKESYNLLQRNYNLEMIEKKSLQSRIGARDEEVAKMKQELRELCGQLLGIKGQDIELQKKNSELVFMQENSDKTKDVELDVIKRVLQTYRKQVKSATSFIHPMQFWDLEAHLTRAIDKSSVSQLQLLTLRERVGSLTSHLAAIEQQHRMQLETVKAKHEQFVSNLNDLIRQKASKYDQMSQEYNEQKHRVKKETLGLEKQISRLINQKGILEKELLRLKNRPTRSAPTQTDVLLTVTADTQVDEDILGIPQISPTPQSGTAVQKADKETDVVGLQTYQQIVRSKIITQLQDKVEPQIYSANQSQPQLVSRLKFEGQSEGKVRESPMKSKPVTKGDFSRAMRLTYLRR